MHFLVFLHSLYNTSIMIVALKTILAYFWALHVIVESSGTSYVEISETEGNTFIGESMQSTPIMHKSFYLCSMRNACRYIIKNMTSGNFALYNSKEDLPNDKKGLRIWKKTYHGTKLVSLCCFHKCSYGLSH